MADEPVYAKCRGCGGFLRHAPVLVTVGIDDVKAMIVPSWHQECVPPVKQSGSRWFGKK